ncbi:MAG: Spy/CpxP family protein refolding chaperone [Candidatus Kryptonium sp.]
MFRKVFALTLLILFSSIFISFTLSQDRSRGYGGFLERLKQELNLTTEQVAKIQKILDSAQKQAEIDREKYQGNREAMMKAMRERWEKIDKEIEAVLTKEQKKKYEVIKKERAQGYRRRPS